ncbi:MAG: helix-turn-helix domain-containing protein [Acidobacteria bacterium]|jgi:transcriptional regulator with XRE-family HTH domain|nr:helix-turn-helix domain-containing protein [Acidobacteriota bacterium]
MTRRTDDLRLAVGHALRRLRNQGQFSLDDVQRGTSEQGMRVTRSHLSRVETGQSELSLPRYLALVRVLGEPAGEVTEALAALIDHAREPDPPEGDPVARAMRLGDPVRAASLLRSVAARGERELGDAALAFWADAEAALGRWSACERALSMALGPALPGEPRSLLRLAVAHLGAGRPGLAFALGRASRSGSAAGLALEAAALLEAGRTREAAELLGAGAATAAAPLQLLLLGEARRREGQPRAALAALRAAAERNPGEVPRAEIKTAEARALADLRKTGPGLRAAHEARAVARRLARPELLARVHLDAARLHRLAGEADESRAALRAARILLGRLGADRRAPRGLPMQALWLAAREADGPSVAVPAIDEDENGAAPPGPPLKTLN